MPGVTFIPGGQQQGQGQQETVFEHLARVSAGAEDRRRQEAAQSLDAAIKASQMGIEVDSKQIEKYFKVLGVPIMPLDQWQAQKDAAAAQQTFAGEQPQAPTTPAPMPQPVKPNTAAKAGKATDRAGVQNQVDPSASASSQAPAGGKQQQVVPTSTLQQFAAGNGPAGAAPQQGTVGAAFHGMVQSAQQQQQLGAAEFANAMQKQRILADMAKGKFPTPMEFGLVAGELGLDPSTTMMAYVGADETSRKAYTASLLGAENEKERLARQSQLAANLQANGAFADIPDPQQRQAAIEYFAKTGSVPPGIQWRKNGIADIMKEMELAIQFGTQYAVPFRTALAMAKNVMLGGSPGEFLPDNVKSYNAMNAQSNQWSAQAAMLNANANWLRAQMDQGAAEMAMSKLEAQMKLDEMKEARAVLEATLRGYEADPDSVPEGALREAWNKVGKLAGWTPREKAASKLAIAFGLGDRTPLDMANLDTLYFGGGETMPAGEMMDQDQRTKEINDMDMPTIQDAIRWGILNQSFGITGGPAYGQLGGAQPTEPKEESGLTFKDQLGEFLYPGSNVRKYGPTGKPKPEKNNPVGQEVIQNRNSSFLETLGKGKK